MNLFKSLNVVTFLLAASLLAFQPMAKAQSGMVFGPHSGEAMEDRQPMKRILRKLDLNENQKQQVKKILENHKQQIKGYFQQLQQGKMALMQQAIKDAFDENAVEKLAQQQSQIFKYLIIEKTRIAQQITKILSADQKIKMDKLQQKRMKIMKIMLEDE